MVIKHVAIAQQAQQMYRLLKEHDAFDTIIIRSVLHVLVDTGHQEEAQRIFRSGAVRQLVHAPDKPQSPGDGGR